MRCISAFSTVSCASSSASRASLAQMPDDAVLDQTAQRIRIEGVEFARLVDQILQSFSPN
jgi:hypothetical protein